jgi:tRNA pseudouridine-54 N-methylase
MLFLAALMPLAFWHSRSIRQPQPAGYVIPSQQRMQNQMQVQQQQQQSMLKQDMQNQTRAQQQHLQTQLNNNQQRVSQSGN